MDVPNKEEWERSFEHVFAGLTIEPLPKSSFSSFRNSNPLKFSRKDEASYKCSTCGRHWVSKNGFIHFSYRLIINDNTRVGSGLVCLLAFGQQCQKCPTGTYVPARFDPEAIDLALQILLLKVKQKFYEENVDNELSLLLSKHTDNEKIRGVHDRARCQACKWGLCSRGNGAEYNGKQKKTIWKTLPGPEPKSPYIHWMLEFQTSRQDKKQAGNQQRKQPVDHKKVSGENNHKSRSAPQISGLPVNSTSFSWSDLLADTTTTTAKLPTNQTTHLPVRESDMMRPSGQNRRFKTSNYDHEFFDNLNLDSPTKKTPSSKANYFDSPITKTTSNGFGSSSSDFRKPRSAPTYPDTSPSQTIKYKHDMDESYCVIL